MLVLIVILVIVNSAGVVYNALCQLVGHVDAWQALNAPKVCNLLVAVVARQADCEHAGIKPYTHKYIHASPLPSALSSVVGLIGFKTLLGALRSSDLLAYMHAYVVLNAACIVTTAELLLLDKQVPESGTSQATAAMSLWQ